MTTIAEALGDDSATIRVFHNTLSSKRHAKAAHLVPVGANLATAKCLRCGAKPSEGFLWKGVRTAEQRAEAARLPLCRTNPKLRSAA
jgi:hypothetical protein